jgi:eukaryotic-like serine/threonine-protein kinase
MAMCLLLSISGCNILQIRTPFSPGPLDTPTFARGTARNNCYPIAIHPPLTLAWESGIAAGVGAGSPVIVDTTVLVATMRGELINVNLRTGKHTGSTSLGGSIEGTPVLDRDVAIVTLAGTGESVIAYDYVNARVRWRANLGDIHGAPLLLGTRIFAANTQGTLYALEHASGETLWHFDLPGNTTLKGIRSSPAGLGDHVVIGADDGALYDLDAETGHLRWRVAMDAAIQAGASIADSTAYVGTLRGTLYAVRLVDGAITWSRALGAGMYAPPLIYGGLCIAGTTGGFVHAVDQRTGVPVWSTELRAPVTAGLLATDTVLYAGTLARELVALGLSGGAILWRDTVSGRIKTMPAAASGRIIIATDDRTLLAFTGARP